MKRIRHCDIHGARIVDIYSHHECREGMNFSFVYFRLDTGLSVQMPLAGYEWVECEIPTSAEKMDDEYWEEFYAVSKGWFGRTKFKKEPSKKIDIVLRIKKQKIQGVYFEKPDYEDYFFEPDEGFILLEDGSQVWVNSVAPEGISTGLSFQEKEQADDRELISFFDIPIER